MSPSDSLKGYSPSVSQDQDISQDNFTGCGSPAGQGETGYNAQMPFHHQTSPAFASGTSVFFSNPQGAYDTPIIGLQHPQTGFQQTYLQPGQAMPAMFQSPTMSSVPATPGTHGMSGTQTLPSSGMQLHGGAMNPSPSSFSVADQAAWAHPEQGPLVQPAAYQDNGPYTPGENGAASDNWTMLHSCILRQGKREGKTAQQISNDLAQLDGIIRSANLVNKRWQRMREGCVPRGELNAVSQTVTPILLQTVSAELARLQHTITPNATGQPASFDRRVEELAQNRLNLLVQDVVMLYFGDDVAL